MNIFDEDEFDAGVVRGDDGVWRISGNVPPQMNRHFIEAIPKYMTAYDKLFSAAKERSEFDFLLSLVHFGFDSNSDPFETTRRTFEAISKTQDELEDYEVQVSVGMWLYGHIVEASYPYQIVGDMVGIASGKPHRYPIFPLDDDGHELSPGRKISQILNEAKTVGLKACLKPMEDAWYDQLRNAIFHSNYAIIGDKILLIQPNRLLTVDEVMKRVNRATASFKAFDLILKIYRAEYAQPKDIDAPEYFAHEIGTKATVVVRDGDGPAAIYDTVKDFDTESPVILGRLTAEEMTLVKSGVFLLPARIKKLKPMERRLRQEVSLKALSYVPPDRLC